MRTGDLNPVQALPTNETQTRRKRNDEDVLQMLVEYRRTQNPALRDRIVLRYTNLVESVARRFSGASEPIEDLAQEGYIGLITAVDLYDPAKNVKFSTYATHFIIGQIKHYLRDRGKIIKEPAWLQELNQRMTRAIETLSQQLSRPPSNIEIARLMDLSEETIAEMMMTREVFKVSSIDGGDNEEDGGKFDMERQTAADVAVPFQIPVEDRIVLESALGKLKDLEQQVVTGFYFKSLNQTEIARQLGISCNYVSHILRNSTKKLKKILVTDELRDARLMMAQMRKRLEDQQPRAQQEAIVDTLTRLYNRRYFETRLEEEMSRASRNNSELSVIFIEIGGLEAFTRNYGTIRGDEAVLGFADTIQQTVRRVDILTRYEETIFALILPFTGENVGIVCSRLTRALDTWLEERGWHAARYPLVFSLGAAVYPRDAATASELISLAEANVPPLPEPLPLPKAA
ncbi:MAG TPA: sigma-70 family RNA polymerase sigma factor [Chthonomonadaceae bacterium]|nr:sigma-70 family RNA polymerase sigma factor [Chthonomonadaceae bacterium]